MPACSQRSHILFPLALIVLIGISLSLPGTALARETRTVADTYTLEVGFIHEPAIQNDTNGLQIRVTQGDKPVEGAADSLKTQAVFGGEARELPLTEVSGEPGLYTSVFIPTQPGEYSFVITGTIGDQAIDETFHSSPDGVPMVASRLDYEFPTAAQGVVNNAAMPAAVGGALLTMGAIGYLVRRHRS